MAFKLNKYSKEALAAFFEPWDAVKEEIAQLYDDKNPEAIVKLTGAIEQYEQLLAYGGLDENRKPMLLSLNGEERLAFIKKQIQSHYAYVQLDALYDESRKKAARLAITKKK